MNNSLIQSVYFLSLICAIAPSADLCPDESAPSADIDCPEKFFILKCGWVDHASSVAQHFNNRGNRFWIIDMDIAQSVTIVPFLYFVITLLVYEINPLFIQSKQSFLQMQTHIYVYGLFGILSPPKTPRTACVQSVLTSLFVNASLYFSVPFSSSIK